MFRDAGFPSGVFNYVTGPGASLGEALVRHPGIAGVTFTGSYEVGMHLYRTFADGRWPREWTLVALNYRGYGDSDGTPAARELLADGLALFDAVAARDDVDARRIVVFGRSLVSAMAAHAAAHRPVAGAVLVSPYDSLAAIGRHHYPWLPVSLLLRQRFDPAADAARSQAPLLAIVADENE